MDHNKLWKILKEMGIADHLTYLLRNLYAGQEARVRTWKNRLFFRKGIHQDYILSSCLFNFYGEYIVQNARLNESQSKIKIARRNTNHLRHADDDTLKAESEEEVKKTLDEGERRE